MLPASKLLLDSVLGTMSATNGATATSPVIDTLGLDFVTIDISATTQSASTQAGSPSVLKLQQCDTTVASNFVDLVGFRGGSATATNVDFVVGVGVTSGRNAYKLNVNKIAVENQRYLTVVVSPTTTQTFQVTANGFRTEQLPVTAVAAGVLSLVGE